MSNKPITLLTKSSIQSVPISPLTSHRDWDQDEPLGTIHNTMKSAWRGGLRLSNFAEHQLQISSYQSLSSASKSPLTTRSILLSKSNLTHRIAGGFVDNADGQLNANPPSPCHNRTLQGRGERVSSRGIPLKPSFWSKHHCIALERRNILRLSEYLIY